MSELRPLTRIELQVLVDLVEAGGHGIINKNKRVCVGPTNSPLKGDGAVWLDLVARGFVAGEYGKIIATELGRQEAERFASGYVVGTP